MKPELIENGPKMKLRGAKWTIKPTKWSKMNQKWSQEEQKLEADRTRWPKTTPQSRPGGPTRAMVAKSFKIDEKSDLKIVHFFDYFSYRFFFNFCLKNRRKNVEKLIEK